MSLLDVRKKFIERSGRYDLATDPPTGDYSDNGADAYINAGQDYLDRKLGFPKEEGEVTKTLTKGSYTLDFTDVRSVQRVWIDTGDGLEYLNRMDIQDIREEYGDETTLANADQGEPVEYAIAFRRNVGSPSAASETEKRLYILPPADGSYDVTLQAAFSSPTLTVDSDVSYWTEQHEHLLVLAAQMSLEEAHRNTSGVRDAKNAIMDRIRDIDFDVVAEGAAAIDQMEDSWDERPFIQ